MPVDERTWLADRLERTYREGNWAGSGVLPALKDLPLEEGHWCPAPEQHTVAEIALHVAYRNRRLAPDSVADPGEDWKPVEMTASAWAAVLDGLDRAHTACARAIRRIEPSRLDEPIPDRPWTVRDVLADLAAHDSYLAAQIFVLRRSHAPEEA